MKKSELIQLQVLLGKFKAEYVPQKVEATNAFELVDDWIEHYLQAEEQERTVNLL